MQYDFTDAGHALVATIDIETTGYAAAESEVVAVGVGVHERGTPADEAEYRLFYRESGDDEAATIRAAVEALEGFDADLLVTYNGAEFDLAYLRERLDLLGADPVPVGLAERNHLDLYVGRKLRADAAGKKWPSLEECLRSYDVTPATTVWDGEPIDNTRFGEELGPAYLDALAADPERATELRSAIDHYLRTDLEANLALFHADIGLAFDPLYAGEEATF